jgi:peptidylprolyl isomerase
MLAVSRGSILIIPACVAVAIAGCGGGDSSGSGLSGSATADAGTTTTTNLTSTGPRAIFKRRKPKVVPPKGPPPKELVINELIEGTGPVAKPGDELTIQYVGAGYQSGTQFDTSWGRQPFVFKLGRGKVLKGLDEGIAGMRVGGRRELIVPPDLAYGAKGTEVIAPNATLVFVVDLFAIK